MTVVADWQIEFNGYLFGDLDSCVDIIEVTGIDDLPDVSHGDIRRGRSHGSVPGPQFVGDRVITATVEVANAATADLRSEVDAISAATAVRSDELPLVFRIGHTEARQVSARVRRRSIPSNQAFGLGHGVAVIQWVATDPNIYAAGIAADLSDHGLHTVQTTAGTVTGGLGYAHGFAHGFGTATTGVMSVRNNGSAPAPWTATLKGPLSGPRIDLVGTTGVLEMNGFDLLDGDTLEFDSKDRTVLLNGTASRFGSLTQSEWFDLPVGSAQVQLATTTGGAHSDALVLQWRDTWQ